MSYHKICETCELPIPNKSTQINPFMIVCSKYHIRCIRCGWPVAKNMMDEDEICSICKRGKK